MPAGGTEKTSLFIIEQTRNPDCDRWTNLHAYQNKPIPSERLATFPLFQKGAVDKTLTFGAQPNGRSGPVLHWILPSPSPHSSMQNFNQRNLFSTGRNSAR
jgi:hypothetical protein